MGFTVRHAMELGHFDKCILLAGKDGLDRQIETVSVLEVPDASSWIRGGELAVTALFGVRDNPEMQVELVEDLAKSGGAGLVIFYTGRYLESLSGDLIDAAERLALPLFWVRDPTMTYSDLIMPITEELTFRKFSTDIIAATHALNLAEEPGPADSIIGCLSEILNRAVVLLSPGFEKLEDYVPAGVKTVSLEQLEKCREKYELGDYDTVNDGIVEIHLPVDEVTILLCQVKNTQRQLLNYLLIREDPGSAANKSTLTFISMALRMYELLHIQREREYLRHARYQHDFVIDLLSGKPASPDIIMERAKLLGLNLHNKGYVIAITVADSIGKDEIARYIHQSLKTLDKDIICLTRHNRIVAIPECSNENPSQGRKRFVKRLVDHIEGSLRESIVVGVGLHKPSFEHLHGSYNEACEAIRLYEILPPKLRNPDSLVTVVYYEDIQHLSLAEQLANSPSGRDYGRQILKVVKDYDDRYKSELLDTMLVYIWEGLYTEKAAKRLFIHVNTLRYRLQKIRDLLQEDPFGDGNLFKYLIALCSTMLKPDADSTA